MKFKTFTTTALSLLLLSSAAHAAIRPALTRVIVQESDKETSVKLLNDDKEHPYLVQSWIEDLNGSDKNLPFVLTPPLFKMNAGREGKLRIVLIPGKIPQDRESVYWLWIQEVPSVTKSAGNQLQLAIRTRLKVFVRPEHLNGNPADTAGQLKWQVQHDGNKSWLVVTNPSPYVVSFSELSVTSAGKTLPFADVHTMVPAKGEQRYEVPAQAAGKSAELNSSLINDFGGDTPVQHQKLTF
ncbi:molecular chaperone [Buttiauxella selenatireducens]|uniref:Molecular chaperone n=1 Tax=Buttiauxella selenatireducens TaxID=3073902 RepID=A0ABY9SBA5_9ENTR|nr:molecular chaperone [Buttiauxella sp. R73]WMY73387.1 molecular chaperone [Buttiauxella sp. R73]